MKQNDLLCEINHYLENNYLSIEELALKAGLSVMQIEQMIHHACIPAHSHKMSRQVVFNSEVFGGAVVTEQTILYFHPSLVNWAIKATRYAKTRDLHNVAASMKADFIAELRKALIDIAETKQVFHYCFNGAQLSDAGVEKIMHEHWPYIMNGTYGVCLKEISARNMLLKLVAVSVLEKWLNGSEQDKHSLHSAAREAATQYDNVAANFAPHEVDKSSRHRLYNKFMLLVDVEFS